ncbi:hypothetical protein JTE90_011463 [Oedothorax gibbosus]|uniref:Rab3 GTPase-activating protein non-catalytic subunit n=1 Tax=Oedothorax gibbosus TaxID=931172 RepID=A0AAV6VCY8_9ARAC|nr:hypothetical protein JTE90_011463 [Oedothorax gibbosus]
MSCHLSKHGLIPNIRSVKSSLKFADETQTPDDYSAEAWNNAWDFEEEEKCNEVIKLKGGDQSWLQDCLTSLSPMVDVMAMAYKQQAVFFTSKWDTAAESEIKLKFVPSFEGKLSDEKNENITSILCLPLASQKRSLQGGPDWTCIVVGFSTGYIRIYTENAEQLLSQKFHEEPIGHLKCKTHVPQHFSNSSDQPDELVIVFSTVVVIIDGFGLFQTLRACRNQLARTAAGRQEVVQPPPLTYKKWGFHEHDKLMNCEAAGVMSITPFDHLVTESVRKGFYGAVKPSVPSNSLLVTTGCNPYVLVLDYTICTEGTGQLLLTDVVHAVASKLMNLISSYNAGGIVGGIMGFNQAKDQKAAPKIEPATILPLRFGLYDKRRQGLSICVSPNKCLAVVTDVFGRVILFDIFKGIAVRMWKGYRDAQCGWVEVEDAVQKDSKNLSKIPRRVFFLVIYAPRRGILEVWCSQQGPRVAAFNVGKSGRLFCPGYSIVGGNYSGNSLSRDHLSSCYFLDVDGILKKVVVPFHLILSEKNSKRARDMHLLRELKMTLKNATKGKSFEIIKILRDMKMSSIRIQALENILSSRHSTVELVEEVVTALLGHLNKLDPLNTDHDTKLLQQCCVRTLQLLKLYTTLNHINGKSTEAAMSPVDSSVDIQQCCVRTLQLLKLYTTLNHINGKSTEAAMSPVDSSVDIQMYSTSLCISEAEVGRILSLVTLHQTVVPVLKRQVRFTDDSATEMTFADFVSCFVVHDSHLVKTGEDLQLQNLPVDLVSNISGKQIEELGGFLFYSSVHAGSYFSTLQVALKDSGVLPEKLLILLLKHWVSDAGFCPSADKWINLQQVMKHISSLSDPKLVSCDNEHVSPWWASVREALHKATGNVAAFIGAVVARSVSVIMAAAFSVEHKNMGKKKKPPEEKLDDSDNSDEEESDGESDWESVSLDLEHWNVLVKQLEDVLMLNVLLKSQPYGKAGMKDTNISIETILTGGQGSVTDLVAVWAVSVGLEPEVLSSFLSETNMDDVSVPQKFLDDTSDSRSLNIVKGLLNEVRRKFPHSLNHDLSLKSRSLLNEVRRKFPHSLNHDTLLANCGWEHLMQWSKNKDLVTHLDQALSCLNYSRSFSTKNGFSAMMWKTYILKTFEATALLMEKVGKTPKERLCRKDLEMTDGHLENFLDFCCQLLNIILETNIPAEHEDRPSFPLESFWQGGGNEKGGRTPLLQMSLAQKAPSNRQVYSHLMLATVLHLVVTFQMKSTKPLSLFTTIIKKFFFRELSFQVPEAVDKEAQGLSTPRTQFLLRAASAVAQGFPEMPPEDQGSSVSQADYSTASKWFGRILDVARGWDLNLDEIRRHYVCELYSGGQDLLAQEVKTSVSDQSLLASQLLLLVGQRSHKVIFDSPDPASRLGCMTPDVSSFLRKLGDMTLRCNNVPLPTTLVLIDQIIVYLPEDSRELKLAVALKGALQDLNQIFLKSS